MLAFSHWTDRGKFLEILRVQSERIREKFERDHRTLYPRFIALHKLIDELLALPHGMGLVKTECRDGKGNLVVIDRPKIFQAVANE